MRIGRLILTGLLAVVLLVALACGGAEAPTVAPPVTQPTTPTDTKSPPVTTQPTGGPPAQVASCVACHTPDGRAGVGPTWQGIYGSEETLADGTTVTVDDAYIRESILEPNIKIVEGFQPNLMPPNFRDTLSDSDIDIIIEYIKSLK